VGSLFGNRVRRALSGSLRENKAQRCQLSNDVSNACPSLRNEANRFGEGTLKRCVPPNVIRPPGAANLGGYGVGDGEAFGEEVFLVLAGAFLVVICFFVVSFFVVAAVELDVELVVVIDSFLLAHDVIKPNAARTAMEVISDCFISSGVVVNERRMSSRPKERKH
jgi:hypothetical protein